MKLVSTRNNKVSMSASLATLKGIAPGGGLYVPEYFPSLNEIGDLAGVSYEKLAAKVLSLFFDDIADMELLTKKAYANFDHDERAPVKKIGDKEFVMELWHGPTLAFKDMALSVLPRLMRAAMAKDNGKDVLILVATSGDTGKAALEGFCDVPGTRIIVFYPSEGVSDMQRLQMVTQGGGNTNVIGIKGNFDDAQTGVKQIFADSEFAQLIGDKGYRLSSANSINFGRLAPQIAYYIWAYNELVQREEIAQGDKINFVVPTGNFGNILAAYYAKRMGLPIAKLICASNKNNVLTDFFNKGEYSLDRDFHKTMSPSMDILISSNLERLLFELVERDSDKVNDMMSRLGSDSVYTIDGQAKAELEEDFYADWCSEAETMACINETLRDKGYLMDTHTAVAMGVYNKYKTGGDTTKTVIVSTASPYKFPEDVLMSLGVDSAGMSVFEMSDELSRLTGTKVPRQVAELKTKAELHTDVIEKTRLRNAVIGDISK
ncbi:MAG: threonine synthase [Clostridia bacterium]|jgi:threonine synthase|nr:threonine synthase [Clostridia bacterium]MBT7121396.1 threonine synthase [Clostridia bacterium]